MSTSAAASTEEFIELLNAEQYVDLQKLRDFARHGVQPTVRGEVWLYLLGVLSDDKSQEMTSVRSKFMEYDSLDKHNALYEKRIRSEAARFYQRRLIPRPPPGRKFGRPFHSVSPSGGHLADMNKGLNRPKDSTSVDGKKNTNSGSKVAAESSASQSSPTPRGPNRVDNGQQRILAGIMGGATLLSSAGSGQESEQSIYLDPEAASAHEKKRFCLAVEDLICAHLNRWKWRTLAGTVLLPVGRSPLMEQNKAQGDSVGDMVRPSSPETAATVHKSIFPGPDQVQRSMSSLPKEYEWAHEPLQEPDSAPLSKGIVASPGQFFRPEYHADLILLCSPFVMCIRSETGMYFAFEKLIGIVENYDVQYPLPARIATFLTLFRTTLPDLYAYFDEEEVDVIGLASAWLRHLLAAEMRIEDLMRLWDTYFAVPDPLDLHLYVCLAILANCKDALEELDQSEAKSMLFNLPPLDIDRIINEAINMRLSHRQSELLHTNNEEQ